MKFWSSVFERWPVSFVFLVFSPLPQNVHPQTEVVKIGRGLLQVHLIWLMTEWGHLFVAHAFVWEQEEGGHTKGLLQPWLLEYLTFPCTQHFNNWLHIFVQMKMLNPQKSDFSNASNRQPTSSQGKQILVYLKNVFYVWNQNTPLNNIMWWKTKGTKEVLVTGSCCVK